ncbi:non-ribosomal peptide synthetase [Mycolicibacterium goodii]|uniref:Amino acid adenylation domain-containing protein n=1 Tax=Mycolicibacterium goodii TaxID=134601 RepID=A0ABS6HGE2_MYCGD|nr:non-ribosomal peptide synthetase [Mycolicibacterium goodii]MBU8821640.1 amino acid adenylation domain-containing protein [Mycolicibacterium goodii]MBU8836036.1 amino acid adenylation domain-containing protein [Mycolicibacterium goodii]
MTDIADTATASTVDARLELMRRKLAERGLAAGHRADGAAPAVDPTVLSDGQRRMWFVQGFDPSGVLLNVSLSYRLTGDLDAERLHGAVNAVARRHPILRTTFHADDNGEPRAKVHEDLAPSWTTHDLSEKSERARKLRLEVLAQREFGTPFDLTTESPLRLTLIKTGPAEHVLLLVAHHIAWDDGCWPVFFNDLTRAYSGENLPDTPRVAITAADTSDEDLAYWREVMANPPEPLELPGPTGSVVPTDFRSQRSTVRLSADTVEKVTALARETGATPYMVLLAAFGALIKRYTHTDDFLVATPVLNRDSGDTIGYYGNTVAMRMRPRGDAGFRDLVLQTREVALGAFAHQRVNLDRVVRELNPDRRHGAERMTRVSFGFREPDGGGFCPDGVTCERAELRGNHTQLPLGFMVEWEATGATVEAEHLTEVLDAGLAEQMLRHFTVLLDNALADPDRALGRLDLVGVEDAAWLTQMATGEAFDTPATTLTDLVTQQAERTPDATAVVYEGTHYTYRAINEAANRLAHWLIAQGIGTEDRVAVLLEKSPELVITALGIVKAGAVYLPVDPTYPEDRLDYILTDSDPKIVLREFVTGLENHPTTDPTDAERVRPLRPDNTAYLIYTSGSTGLPKGVPVPHRPIAEYFVWFGGEYDVTDEDRLLQVASQSFDVSIGEIFGMLAAGARLVIPKPGGLTDIGYLTDLLRNEGITSMHFVPSLLGLFLSLPGVNEWRTLRRVPIGGEALPGEIADKFHATFDSLLHNFYGPTETVLNCTRYKVEGKQGARIVPIGKPKINTRIHLLDAALQPVPVGVIGEIYIGGTHIANGYHRRPGLTAERFVADPFNPGGRMYRSGDLARRNADGDIEFVGRADEQVKIRGFRIELGEVSSAISVDPSVGQAVVVVSDLPSLGRSLVAYITPAAGADHVDIERIRARVTAALPEYMVPSAFVELAEIPITAHGKIDRRALPEPEITSTTEFREPSTDTERQVAGLFAELLDRAEVGADDSFFDLGGHSLLATKLVAAVRTRCGVDVGVQDIFEHATVSGLAAHIDELVASGASTGRPAIVAVPHDGPLQMSAAQLRQWFQFRIDGPNPVNNVPFAARLAGPCDVDALIAAVSDVVERHEILRTTYREIDGAPYQIVHPPAPVPVRQARGDGEEWLQAELDAERKHCFDLETDWPIRAAVLATGEHHVLSLVVHHIAADHWSGTVLFTDLLTAYRARRTGGDVELPSLPVQYADFAAWQADLLAGSDDTIGEQRRYWTTQLAGLPEENGLQPDFPRPPVPTGEGAALDFGIDADTRARLIELTRELGVTEFMLLQAAVAIALHKAGQGTDIPLGTPVAGRTAPELDALIGFFINIVVLRNDLSGNPTLREVLRRSREMALAAYQHQDLPFDRVVDAVSPVRSLSRNPLFGVVVHVREDLPTDQVISDSADGETRFTALEPTFDVAHADLSLNFFAQSGFAPDGQSAGQPGGYKGTIIYRTELYEPSTAQRLVGWLHRIIDAFATDADKTLRDIAVIEPGERTLLLEDWSRKAVPPALPQTAGATNVYVLDEWLEPVAIGVIGDVYYAGGAVSAAAEAADGVAVQRFVPNPFGPGRLYRTGDRARWTADGRLEPVTCGEPRLQAALEAVDGVAAAMTRYWDNRSAPLLAGYVVADRALADGERAQFLESVRAALSDEFTDVVVTVVDDLGPDALTRPATTASAPFEAPRTDTERTVAAMLVELLEVAQVGRHDDFFTLGGDSILAVQLAARARDAGVAMTARMVFEHPVLAELAAAVDATGDAAGQADAVRDVHHAPMEASGLSPDELAGLTASWGRTQDGTP